MLILLATPRSLMVASAVSFHRITCTFRTINERLTSDTKFIYYYIISSKIYSSLSSWSKGGQFGISKFHQIPLVKNLILVASELKQILLSTMLYCTLHRFLCHLEWLTYQLWLYGATLESNFPLWHRQDLVLVLVPPLAFVRILAPPLPHVVLCQHPMLIERLQNPMSTSGRLSRVHQLAGSSHLQLLPTIRLPVGCSGPD